MIIGLIGPKGCGKTTLAKRICLRGHPAPYIRVRFAEGLKKMLEILLREQYCPEEIISAMLEGNLKEESSNYLAGKSSRYAQQTLGTEWGRNLIHPDFWVAVWKNSVGLYSNVVVDDVRFLNEADAIRAKGGVIVKIVRPTLDDTDLHRSEQEYKQIVADHLILNEENNHEKMYTRLCAALNLD